MNRNVSGNTGISRVKQPKTLDQDVYTLALERTAYILDTHDDAIVSFSGGKDSTAVLNIALEVINSDPIRYDRYLPLRVVHFDEEAIPLQTEEYVRRVSRRPDLALEWYCLPVKHRNASSRKHPYWWPWAPEDQHKWCRPLPDGALTTLPGFPIHPPERRLSIPASNGLLAPNRKKTAMLMGIRAQESLTRRRAVSQRPVDNYIIPYSPNDGWTNGNIFKTYPIYDWWTEDIWTATTLKGWDYNHAYDLMEMMGISAASQRCSPAFGEEPLQKIHVFAQCFPEVWATMSERVPGIGAAYRYARTELYGYGTLPEKPDDVTWPDFITRYLNRWGAKEAETISYRVFDSIRRHYRKTQLPILYSESHPTTGLDWKFLLKLAMRGDFKDRRKETHKLRNDPEQRRQHWHRYAEELTQQIRQGITARELGHPTALPANPYDHIPKEYQ